MWLRVWQKGVKRSTREALEKKHFSLFGFSEKIFSRGFLSPKVRGDRLDRVGVMLDRDSASVETEIECVEIKIERGDGPSPGDRQYRTLR